ncbi:MAG TPA: sigma-E factor regulatory protein RseB domain-containing protein [Armatimonadota bacterium]|jgi:outer membrane lipoprotein-sorting protein
MSRRTVSTIYRRYRQDGRERLEYLAPRSKAGQIVISTGKGHWHLQPRRKTAVYDPVVYMGARLDMALLRQNYAFELGPKVETVAERPCYRVVLRPRHAGKGKRIFWLDRATGLSLKTESYHADGSPAGTTYITDISLGKRLPASLFITKPAPGTRVTRLPILTPTRLPSGIQLPATLPGGYHLLSPRPVADPRGRLHLSYFDGIDLLSYYVSPGGARAATHPRSKSPTPRRLALVADHHFMIGSWLDGGYDRSLVGDVGPRLMRAIAAAL